MSCLSALPTITHYLLDVYSHWQQQHFLENPSKFAAFNYIRPQFVAPGMILVNIRGFRPGPRRAGPTLTPLPEAAIGLVTSRLQVNLRYQDALDSVDWHKWTKGRCGFPFCPRSTILMEPGCHEYSVRDSGVAKLLLWPLAPLQAGTRPVGAAGRGLDRLCTTTAAGALRVIV